mmetsp:Transcript_41572/g.117632  ORF Transcript_41572/g.117632 Transcript_41572/m.117632 type:complete len:292 (-) Transcript_41572:153-1028(-)
MSRRSMSQIRRHPAAPVAPAPGVCMLPNSSATCEDSTKATQSFCGRLRRSTSPPSKFSKSGTGQISRTSGSLRSDRSSSPPYFGVSVAARARDFAFDLPGPEGGAGSMLPQQCSVRPRYRGLSTSSMCSVEARSRRPVLELRPVANASGIEVGGVSDGDLVTSTKLANELDFNGPLGRLNTFSRASWGRPIFSTAFLMPMPTKGQLEENCSSVTMSCFRAFNVRKSPPWLSGRRCDPTVRRKAKPAMFANTPTLAGSKKLKCSPVCSFSMPSIRRFDEDPIIVSMADPLVL